MNNNKSRDHFTRTKALHYWFKARKKIERNDVNHPPFIYFFFLTIWLCIKLRINRPRTVHPLIIIPKDKKYFIIFSVTKDVPSRLRKWKYCRTVHGFTGIGETNSPSLVWSIKGNSIIKVAFCSLLLCFFSTAALLPLLI